MTTPNEIIQQTATIPSWTSENERRELISLASQVPAGGVIVEIGALYGGMTVVMGVANPSAKIVVVDNFSWHPDPADGRPPSKKRLLENVKPFGLTNLEVKDGDSRLVGKMWTSPIDLLWVDGGHSYPYVHSDLVNFGPHAQVIACHDWDNPFWPDIRQAVEDFLREYPEWTIDHNTDMVVVLKRKK